MDEDKKRCYPFNCAFVQNLFPVYLLINAERWTEKATMSVNIKRFEVICILFKLSIFFIEKPLSESQRRD